MDLLLDSPSSLTVAVSYLFNFDHDYVIQVVALVVLRKDFYCEYINVCISQIQEEV